MAQILKLPRPVMVDSSIRAVAGALLNVYEPGTTTRKDSYQDDDLTTPHTNPVVADAGGLFPQIFLDPAERYKITVTTSAGALLYTADPANDSLTANSIGTVLYPRTAAEISAGVTPTNYAYPPGDVRRYGNNTTPGTTDMTTVLQAMASVARQAVGLKLVFQRETYRAWPAGTGSTLFDLSDCIGVTVEGNGATISVGDVISTSAERRVFDLGGVEGFGAYGLNFTQDSPALNSDYGAVLFHMDDGAKRLHFENISMTGGLRGIHGFGTAAGGGTAANDITALNCEFNTVYYPQQFRMSGNNYFARGIRTINCGRAYFPFNVYNHDVEMYSEPGGEFDDVLLKNYTYTAEFNQLSNIRLVYRSPGRNASAEVQAAGNAHIAVEFQLVDTTAGHISNLDVKVDIDALAADAPTRAFIMRKFTAAGAADTTARGHKVTNLKLSGIVRNWEEASGTCVDVFSTAGYDWTGDEARNISLEDLSIEDSTGTNVSIAINGQPFGETRGISLKRIQCGGNIQRNNWDAEFPFDAEQVQAGNLSIHSAWKDYTPTVTASGGGFAIGNGSIVGKYRRSGDWVTVSVQVTMGSTTTFGTGTYTFSIPVNSANEAQSSWGSGLILDSGANRYVCSAEVTANAANARLWADATTGPVGATVPITFAQDDVIYFQVTYFAAP